MNKKKHGNKLSAEVIRAIYGDRIQEVENWIDKSGVNILDSDGRNIVIHGIIANNADVLKLVLELKENPNIKDRSGWYPLHYAAQENYALLAEIVLQYGAIVDCEDDYGNTPLWRAVFSYRGHGEMIEFLLRNGANPNHDNHSNVSPRKLANTITNYDAKRFFTE